MQTFAAKEQRSAPAARKARPYVHHPMGPVQQRQRAEIRRILRSTGAQAKLTIGQPNDKYEQEADRVADQVMAMPDADVAQRQPEGEEEEETLQTKSLADQITPLVQRQEEPPEEEEETVQAKAMPGQTPNVSSGLESRINSLKGGGQPLDSATRNFFEPRFGHDFSHARVHSDGKANQLARSVNARAFTLGKDVVFGAGAYQPQSQEGKRLLGHELTHVVQQRRNGRLALQRSRLRDFADTSNPAHDPSHLTDAQIEATNEFKSYRNASSPWQTVHHMTPDEARLACRLILRAIREGQSITWGDARRFMGLARAQLGTLTSAEAFVGINVWVPFSSSTASTTPAALRSEFGRWLLAGGPEPATSVSEMNCWEIILFSAYVGGFLSRVRLQAIYDLAVANVTAGIRTSVGDTVESELRSGAVHIFDPGDPDSPAPLAGDMVIFNRAAVHAAISLGTTTTGTGDHTIVSFWEPVNGNPHVERTTIERVLSVAAGAGITATPVRFWNVNWS